MVVLGEDAGSEGTPGFSKGKAAYSAVATQIAKEGQKKDKEYTRRA